MNTKVRETYTKKPDSISATSGKKKRYKKKPCNQKIETYQCIEKRLIGMKMEKERVCVCVCKLSCGLCACDI